MLSVRLAGDHLYEKKLFTWLSLGMSLMVSFCAVLFPTRRLMRSGIKLSQFLRVFLPTVLEKDTFALHIKALGLCYMAAP